MVEEGSVDAFSTGAQYVSYPDAARKERLATVDLYQTACVLWRYIVGDHYFELVDFYLLKSHEWWLDVVGIRVTNHGNEPVYHSKFKELFDRALFLIMTICHSVNRGCQLLCENRGFLRNIKIC